MSTEKESLLHQSAALPSEGTCPRGGENSTRASHRAERKGKALHRKRKHEKIIPAESDSEEEEDGSPLSAGCRNKRSKKARRARRRPYKGYYEMNERERSKMEERQRLRADKIRERMRAKGHMLAPYNSTTFLLSDHDDDKVRSLERQLLDSSKDLFKTSPTKLAAAVRRGRDSSFSLDSDEGYFYSSPEDEEEFLSKEFRKDYEMGNVDRLEQMDKGPLIREYLAMEKTVEDLEKRLEEINTREVMKALTGEVDYEFHRGEVPMEPETAEKINVFQTEILRLMKENKGLRLENASLKRRFRGRRPSYSSATSSSSSSSSSSESSASESSSEDESVQELLEDRIKLEDGKTEDTGYESTQSKEQTPEPDGDKTERT